MFTTTFSGELINVALRQLGATRISETRNGIMYKVEFKLSDDSPFGRAVVGKAAGETFTVNAPAGSFTMKVVSVSREG